MSKNLSKKLAFTAIAAVTIGSWIVGILLPAEAASAATALVAMALVGSGVLLALRGVVRIVFESEYKAQLYAMVDGAFLSTVLASMMVLGLSTEVTSVGSGLVALIGGAPVAGLAAALANAASNHYYSAR